MSVAKRGFQRKNYDQLQRQLYWGTHRSEQEGKTKFVFSRKDGVLHDRTCKYASRISGLDGEFLTQLPEHAVLCPCCDFTAIIRNSIRLGERVDVYINFFGKVGATLEDVKLLLWKHGAYLKWKDFNTMQFKVHDDYWLVRCKEGSMELLHNNYFVDEQGNRIFGTGFHSQAVPGQRTFSDMCQVMTEYTWEKHRGLVETEVENLNWVSLSEKGDRIAFVGNEVSAAVTLFQQEGIEVSLEAVFRVSESGFCILICKVEKGQEKLPSVLRTLDSMVGNGDTAYQYICHELVTLFQQPIKQEGLPLEKVASI